VFELNTEQLKKYVGHFELQGGNEFIDFKIEDNSLVGYSNDGQRNMFLPTSKGVFKTRIMDVIDIYIEFEMDSTGDTKSINSNFAFTQKSYKKQNNEEK